MSTFATPVGNFAPAFEDELWEIVQESHRSGEPIQTTLVVLEVSMIAGFQWRVQPLLANVDITRGQEILQEANDEIICQMKRLLPRTFEEFGIKQESVEEDYRRERERMLRATYNRTMRIADARDEKSDKERKSEDTFVYGQIARGEENALWVNYVEMELARTPGILLESWLDVFKSHHQGRCDYEPLQWIADEVIPCLPPPSHKLVALSRSNMNDLREPAFMMVIRHEKEVFEDTIDSKFTFLRRSLPETPYTSPGLFHMFKQVLTTCGAMVGNIAMALMVLFGAVMLAASGRAENAAGLPPTFLQWGLFAAGFVGLVYWTNLRSPLFWYYIDCCMVGPETIGQIDPERSTKVRQACLMRTASAFGISLLLLLVAEMGYPAQAGFFAAIIGVAFGVCEGFTALDNMTNLGLTLSQNTETVRAAGNLRRDFYRIWVCAKMLFPLRHIIFHWWQPVAAYSVTTHISRLITPYEVQAERIRLYDKLQAAPKDREEIVEARAGKFDTLSQSIAPTSQVEKFFDPMKEFLAPFTWIPSTILVLGCLVAGIIAARYIF